MAWHIVFSKKYLRSQEEFKKNHVQIPSKSPFGNSQSLAKI
jgi:hypothetical protein